MKRFLVMVTIFSSFALGIALAQAESRPKVLIIPREGSPVPKVLDLMLTKEVGIMVSMLKKAGFEVVIATASGTPQVGSNTTLRPDLKVKNPPAKPVALGFLPTRNVDAPIGGFTIQTPFVLLDAL